MQNKPFVVEYPIRLNDISVDSKLRSWVAFDYLQDAAGKHADLLGLGLQQLRNSDLSWVLSRIRLKMDDFPAYGDTLRITTYPSGFDRLFAYRQFVLSSAKSGRVFGVAGSAWLTLNTGNFRPVSPARYLTDLVQWQYDEAIYFQGETLGKIAAADIADDTPTMERVSCSMIDYNRHLNNAFYAMFTENYLGAKSSGLIRMKEIQLNFNQSTPLAEEIECRGIIQENGAFYTAGFHRSSGKNAFQAQGIFEKIIPETDNKTAINS